MEKELILIVIKGGSTGDMIRGARVIDMLFIVKCLLIRVQRIKMMVDIYRALRRCGGILRLILMGGFMYIVHHPIAGICGWNSRQGLLIKENSSKYVQINRWLGLEEMKQGWATLGRRKAQILKN